jgi:DUF971 family protein
MASSPIPESIEVRAASRVLALGYADGTVFELPFELLRVYSPSAEVMGHGPGQETLQTGKRLVQITDLEPVGHYAIKPLFSDGHASGIFTWDYLYQLGTQKDALWQQYLDKLAAAGLSRDAADMSAPGSAGHGCGGGSCGCH